MSRRFINSTSSETSITALVITALVMFVIGGWFGNWSNNEYGLWWAWQYPTTLLAGLKDVWYIFAWAFGFSVLVAIWLIRRQKPGPGQPIKEFGAGIGISAIAGIWEEIIFRWILVLGAPASLTLFNWLTFGLVKWIYT